ncbi:hypothetical protein Maes01_02491 [Microbulbifer aestuariivivens]|uniref:TPM domain-containing protein n=1 Tax=Microbulbifer aestuariivivens TaxID=1908308 RepID=A0ABP9WRT6_9GAMM
MINYLVNLTFESTRDELLDAAFLALKKYQLLDAEVSKDDDGVMEDLYTAIDHSEAPALLVFDTECIENAEDYASLAGKIFCAAGERKKIRKIKSALDFGKEKAGIAILVGEQKEKHIWPQGDDCVSSEFTAFIDRVLNKHFSKRLLHLPSNDQCAHILVVDEEDYEPIAELLKFDKHGYTNRELYSTRLVCTCATAAVGFVVTTLSGWYFWGFWWSLLGSAAFWVLFAALMVLRYAWICAADEQAEEDLAKLKELPSEEFGKAIMGAFMDEAIAREGNSKMGKRLQAAHRVNQAIAD